MPKWVILYCRRWLQAPMQSETGLLQERGRGTPQGGVISPLLANLFLHYAFDRWMDRTHRVCRLNGMPTILLFTAQG
jgi:retron-type reverse transcriptase